jgi:hypothetical protein
LRRLVIMRERDLTEIIGKRTSKAYLSRALAAGWNGWGRYEREEADALHPRLRRLARAERQRRLGLQTLC